MHIEKIELIGFKSFSEKTTFHFHHGITCIVGPNGCGKSNIVDAFRWVLGEQSAKSLRGEKMEEVIFNGSASKKPKGMAEVTLVVSGVNGSQQSSPDENGDSASDTASVTRRLYRSGESEYVLNKTQCRLKDIRDMFLDTGLEVKSYSILEQDRIAEILNAKPQDRRFLIEEVAGVMKYNVRKKEAMAKLDSSRANLQRIHDIIIEVKKQINFLDRLARKAERFKRLTADIHAIELKIAKKEYQGLKESFGRILASYNALRADESMLRAELSATETETETKRIELLEKEKALEEVQTKFRNLEREIAEIEKSIAVAHTERDNYKEYLSRLFQQQEEYTAKENEREEKLDALLTAEAALQEETERQRELLREKSELARSLEEELSEHEDALEGKRREIFRISEEISNIRNNQSRLQTSFDGLKQREETSGRDSENLKQALSAIDTSLRELEQNLLGNNKDLLMLNEKKGIVLNELSANKSRIEGLRETFSRLKEEQASYTSRIESLREVLSDESGQELLSEDVPFSILSSISDVIEIEDEYEKAIESALSEKVNSFVLSSLDDIELAIATVKQRGAGRTAFIPAQGVQGDTFSPPEGSLGSALNFIRAKEGFAEVARSLLGHVFLVRDIKTAFHLISSGHHFLFATREGEVIEPSGVVITGEIRGVFRRKREIRELEAAVEKNKANLERLQSELNALVQSTGEGEAELKQIEAAIISREKDVSLLKLTEENFREDRERKSRKLAYLTLELEQLSKERASLEQLLREKEEELQVIDARRSESEQQNASLQEELSGKRSRLEEHRSEVTDIRLSITSLREKSESVLKEKESLEKERAEGANKKDLLSEELSSVQSRIFQREEEMKDLEAQARSLVAVADQFRKEISERKEVIDSENQELIANDHKLKLLRSRVESTSQKIAELDIQRAEHTLKMGNITAHIRQNFGLDLDTAEVEPLTEEDGQRLAELRQKVEELGPVNLGTLEEYEELRTRYEFLKTQEEDLTKSIAELEEAISKINVTTRKKLREAFEAMKVKFSEVFLMLFGGGRAELVMTDENNILDTGIDIIAQPPGKRLQNISLLSGGEKTLTALSLLFASFLLKPTPLCILDEADSALDEANTEKFSRMIRDFSKDTQFIVVTHNRNTMSVADYIYGITMEEAGCSKVISMQLVEA
ncbi:MAG: chromosome segregation protein SMC [Nitrospirota bacterium]